MQDSAIPSGWVGGFSDSCAAFAYPTPDLSSLPMLDNMDKINLLKRQQAIWHPEFSWQTIPGDPDSRCFQMFAPDISRLGYTNEGRIYSIICPQQGICSPNLGCMNVEVTVTGQRGWVNETTKEVAADMTVEAKVWFTPSALANWKIKLLWAFFNSHKLPFPFSKATAIRIPTYKPGNPAEPNFPILKGENPAFASPEFARHPATWTVAYLGVEMSTVAKTGHALVDEFNELIMFCFNLASGNMLKAGNVLSWNLWFNQPTLVDTEEWSAHAELWRESLQSNHGSPHGEGTSPRYFNGDYFKSALSTRDLEDTEEKRISDFIQKHLHNA